MQLVASTEFSKNNEIESLPDCGRETDGRTDRQRHTRRRYQRKQTVPRRQLSMHVMRHERQCTSSSASVVILRSILRAARTACQKRPPHRRRGDDRTGKKPRLELPDWTHWQ